MDRVNRVASGGIFPAAIFAIFITAVVMFIAYNWAKSCVMPSYENYQAPMGGGSTRTAAAAPPNLLQASMLATSAEGFEGESVPARVEGFRAAEGSGGISCMSASADAAATWTLLSKKALITEEGPDDLREMKLILGKIACLKQDLTGAAGLVSATRSQPFSTAHDMEPVAETAARCFAHTIPQRDLSLILDKWGSRGTFLIKRLCTSEQLTTAEEKEALDSFGLAMADLADIAMGRCCKEAGAAQIAGVNQPRMIGGFEPPVVASLRDYNGYY
jgi:hypothetical protein